MPTYEYRCTACRHEFEEFQSMTAKPLRDCPACGKKSLQRLIGTGAALVFKGSGFYQTDYRSESYKKAAEAEKPASHAGTPEHASKAQSTPENKSEPKPDPRPEPKSEAKSAAKSDPKPETKKARKRA